jgi:hypothetical protein
VVPLGAEIGPASGMKMSYAALTKGLTALGAEVLVAAAKQDLLDPLLAELGESQPALLDWLERAVPGMPAKSRRWISEMEEIAATLGHVGQSPGYHHAAAAFYHHFTTTRVAAERPENRGPGRTLRTIIAALAGKRPAGQGEAA